MLLNVKSVAQACQRICKGQPFQRWRASFDKVLLLLPEPGPKEPYEISSDVQKKYESFLLNSSRDSVFYFNH